MQMIDLLSRQENRRGILRVQWCFRGAIAACALINCWVSRFEIASDSVSYLDMGDLYWKGNWHAALNGLWSPLYGWLTGLMFLLTKPTMLWEYPEVHLLNFAILIATLFCFEFFWRELLASGGGKAWVGGARTFVWVLGYLLFAYVHLVIHPLALVTPDLLAAALLYVSSGMMLRFASGRMGAPSAILLGVTLGLGYLTKAAMLPFAVVFMTTMLAVAWKQHRGKWLFAFVLLGFLITSFPFIAALSWNMHRFTWGDSAKLNYALWVNHPYPPYRYWQGDRPGHEDALHPARKVFAWPEIYEYATPIEGTYPVWYDPCYWNAGMDSSIHPLRQAHVFRENMKTMVRAIFLRLSLIATLALLLLVSKGIKDWCRNLMTFWPILIPAVAVCLMYMMVHWEARFTSGEMLVAWGAAIVSTGISEEERRTKLFLALSLLLGAWVAYRFSTVLIDYRRANKSSAQAVMVAQRLRAMGVEPGDHVAIVGDALAEEDWARLEKVRIIAEVPNETHRVRPNSAAAFWESNPEGEIAVLEILKSTGAMAVVADTPPTTLPSGWVPVGNTGHAIYFFR
jgi:hypothetical protein